MPADSAWWVRFSAAQALFSLGEPGIAALKKSARERYATVDALARDLERYLAGERVVARPDSPAYRLARFGRRHRTPLVAAAITVAAFGLAIGVGATALVILALLLILAYRRGVAYLVVNGG